MKVVDGKWTEKVEWKSIERKYMGKGQWEGAIIRERK